MSKDDQKMRVVCYCRVATKAQLDETPMKTQSARLHQQAEREGYEIIGEISAYEKGSTLNRPGWHNVLSLASRQQADAILVTNINRIARNSLLIYQAFSDMDKLRIRLYTCDGEIKPNNDLCQLARQYMHQIM